MECRLILQRRAVKGCFTKRNKEQDARLLYQAAWAHDHCTQVARIVLIFNIVILCRNLVDMILEYMGRRILNGRLTDKDAQTVQQSSNVQIGTKQVLSVDIQPRERAMPTRSVCQVLNPGKPGVTGPAE